MRDPGAVTADLPGRNGKLDRAQFPPWPGMTGPPRLSAGTTDWRRTALGPERKAAVLIRVWATVLPQRLTAQPVFQHHWGLLTSLNYKTVTSFTVPN